mgnify:FL=1
MYKNRAPGGRNNLCGEKVKKLREGLPEKPSQREFAEMLQREGVDLDKNAVQRLESGARFVTDIELKALAKVLHVSYEALLDDPK